MKLYFQQNGSQMFAQTTVEQNTISDKFRNDTIEINYKASIGSFHLSRALYCRYMLTSFEQTSIDSFSLTIKPLQ